MSGLIIAGLFKESRAHARVRLMNADDWRTDMVSEGLSELTIHHRTERLRLFTEWLGRDPSDARSGEITGYLAQIITQRGEPPLAATLATYRAHLRSYYRWLYLTNRRDDDPFHRIKPGKGHKSTPNPVTVEQFQRLLALPMRRQTRMMLYLAAYQGLRVHEIAKIAGQDVDLDSRQMRVRGKGDSHETIELHPVVVEEAAHFPKRGWWFPDGEGGHVPARIMSDHGLAMMRAIGIQQGGLHRLRHLTASALLEQGVDIRHIQKVMRHQNIASTTGYSAVTRSQLRNVMDNFTLDTKETP